MVYFKTDEIQQLIKRNIDFMSANSIEGIVSVSQAAFFVSNVRDRVISTISVKKCDNHWYYSFFSFLLLAGGE